MGLRNSLATAAEETIRSAIANFAKDRYGVVKWATAALRGDGCASLTGREKRRGPRSARGARGLLLLLPDFSAGHRAHARDIVGRAAHRARLATSDKSTEKKTNALLVK